MRSRARSATVGETRGELADHVLVGERAAFEHGQSTGGGDGAGLTVREVPDRDGALGHEVAEFTPGVDQLVELQVQLTEHAADNAPMELLADQRQVDELNKQRLQFVADLLTDVGSEWRKVRCGLRSRSQSLPPCGRSG